MDFVLKQTLKEGNKSVKMDLECITKDIDKQKQRMQNARALMLDGEITPDDYKEMRSEIENMLQDLRIKELLLKGGNENYDKDIDFCVSLLKEIDKVYKDANTEGKQLIIGSIFPERLIFENNKYRTPKLNRVVSLICNNNGQSKGGKKRKHTFLDVLSCKVESEGFEPSSKQGINMLSTCVAEI